MAKVKPFKGVRPPRELVEEVASRPYDVLNSEEARKEAEGNEKSLYHISSSLKSISNPDLTNMTRRFTTRLWKLQQIPGAGAGSNRMTRRTTTSMRRPWTVVHSTVFVVAAWVKDYMEGRIKKA